jgi:DNA-binding MarR family transcriptional regulator
VDSADNNAESPKTRQLRTPEEARSSREALIALQNVYIETEALYHQSSAFFEQIHGQGELSMARRNLLVMLLQGNPQTVPQLARARLVSRQYMQRLVNQLAAEGYIEFVENAAHKRSHLVQLTPQGRAHIIAMLQREAKIVAAMVIDMPPEQLRETAQALRAIREWQKAELGRLLQEFADQQSCLDQENAQ